MIEALSASACPPKLSDGIMLDKLRTVHQFNRSYMCEGGRERSYLREGGRNSLSLSLTL